MSIQGLQELAHPAAWSAADLSFRKSEWVYQLSADDLAELDIALHTLEAKGLQAPNFDRNDFPIPRLIVKLEPMIDRLDTGLGILRILGLSREKYSKEQASALFWGIGSYIGKPWEQNANGDLLGDVRDVGRSINDPNARGYQTDVEMELHTDVADVTGLLCLNKAAKGGSSQIASSISVLNWLMRERPESAKHLLDADFYFDWRGEEGGGRKAVLLREYL